jgi:GAF domain-containing protein
LDLGVIAAQTVEYASLLLGLPAAAVLFRREVETDFGVLASDGLPKRLSRMRVTSFEVAGLGVPWSLSAMRNSPGSLFDALRERGLANTFVAPLVVGDARGAVLLGLERPERHPTEEEHNAFELLAIQSATAMRSAALYEEAVEAARLSDALNIANGVVHSTLDIDLVMQRALDTGAVALGCEAAAIEILEADAWVVRYQHGFSAATVGMHLSEEDASNPVLAAELGMPVAVDVVPDDNGIYARFVKRRSLRSVLSVPLMVRSEVIGRAQFYSSSAVTQFADAEIDFGRKLGSTVSLSYENARLYESQHRIAETLQQALLTLPDRIPGIEFEAYYHSATESTLVGGDFYDLFELDSRRVGVIIGDIAGKGLAAAALTSLVRNTIRAYAFENDKLPAEILRLTNDVVEKATPDEAFATVFFGVLDREDGQLTYSSAGHTRSAILRQDATVSTLESTGPVLGAFADMDFGEATTCLDEREILFLYTDGLTEARRDRDLYGEGRLFADLGLAEHSSPENLATRVLTNVMAFARGRLRDDLAILAVERVGSIPRT